NREIPIIKIRGFVQGHIETSWLTPSRFKYFYQERQRAGGRRQKGILIPALKPVTVGNKGLRPPPN
ncbi:MAG: hypothetical protein V7L26_32530, partial [Nostoc sp.]|uniref:hypothetical protein n=1 Tax=Nostoc sp. TaxID=1180 RepID=UPI003B5F638F